MLNRNNIYTYKTNKVNCKLVYHRSHMMGFITHRLIKLCIINNRGFVNAIKIIINLHHIFRT